MGGGGDCGTAWAPARGPGREGLSFLSCALPILGLGHPLLHPVTLHSAPKACLWSGDLLTSTWVGREMGPEILGSDSGPAQPTDYKRILASGPPKSPP